MSRSVEQILFFSRVKKLPKNDVAIKVMLWELKEKGCEKACGMVQYYYFGFTHVPSGFLLAQKSESKPL